MWYYCPLPDIQYRVYDGVNICAKLSTSTYLDLNIVDEDGTCPPSTPIKCGNIDSLNNLLCAASISECPMKLDLLPKMRQLYH